MRYPPFFLWLQLHEKEKSQAQNGCINKLTQEAVLGRAKAPGLAYRKSGRRELSLPSSHTTVRTGPYTAVHDYCDLASTIFFIGIYPIASMTPFDMALCMP